MSQKRNRILSTDHDSPPVAGAGALASPNEKPPAAGVGAAPPRAESRIVVPGNEANPLEASTHPQACSHHQSWEWEHQN